MTEPATGAVSTPGEGGMESAAAVDETALGATPRMTDITTITMRMRHLPIFRETYGEAQIDSIREGAYGQAAMPT